MTETDKEAAYEAAINAAVNEMDARRVALLVTKAQLARAAGMSGPTYWRTVVGEHADVLSSMEARIRNLRRLNGTLDKIEKGEIEIG